MSNPPSPLAIRLFVILSLMMAAFTTAAQGQEIHVRDSTMRVYIDGDTRVFDSFRLGQGTSVNLTITNQGFAPLTGLALSVDGAHPEDYVITQGLTQTELTIGTSTTFTLEFKPTAVGIRTATLHIANNDEDEGPFDIPLTGEGSVPEIRVEDPQGDEILQGGSYSFGTRSWISQGTQRQFTIKNTGSGLLKVSGITCTGTHEENFIIVNPVANQGARPGADLNLTVAFNPSTYGLHTATVTITSDDEDESSFAFTVTGTGSVPGLQVEQVAGTPLVNDEIVTLGSSGVNEPTGKPVTLTIKNPGTKNLTLATTLSGGNAADFSITSAPATTVQPGQSTTVTVLFLPKADGARQSRLRFAHNAMLNGGTTSFFIQLNGQGVNSEIEFDSPVFTALHGDTQGLVKLKRTEAGVPATVELQTLAGLDQAVPPLKAAQPEVDFTALSGQAVVVSFAAGQAEKTVSVPLLAPASGAKINRHLRLQLANPSAGAVTTSPSAATLRILGSDAIKPTLTVAAPAAGKVSAVLPFVVSGKAGDAMGIDRVEVKVGSADPVPAELGSTNSNTAVPFTCHITPATGTQDIVVTAYDLRGNSTSVKRTITFTRRYTLRLKVGYAYDDAKPGDGTLSLTATPASAASPLSVDGNERYLSVVPGTKLNLKATTKPGKAFNSWYVFTNGNSETLNQSYLGGDMTLTMPEADLHVTAFFVPAPFDPPAGESRTLHWLLTPENPASKLAESAYLTGTLTSAGGFSGKFYINGQIIPVAATFFPNELAVFTVAGKKRGTLPYPGGQLTIGASSSNFGAYTEPTDSETVAQAAGTAKRGLSSTVKGYYTMRLDNTAPASATTPAAPGYATANVTSTGAVTLAGALSDGTTFTHSTALLLDSQAILFAQLPTPGGTTKLGLVSGLLDLDSGAALPHLRWFRPAAASSKVALYPAGWPAGLSLNVVGGFYDPTITVQKAFFPDAAANTSSAARLLFTGGKLPAPVEKTNFYLKGNSVVKMLPADNSYTLTVNAATGLFSGTFTPNWSNPGSAKPAFKGVILQGDVTSGFFINNAKGETAPESGAVTLGPPLQ